MVAVSGPEVAGIIAGGELSGGGARAFDAFVAGVLG
jgi:hypothetical protein